MLARSASRVGFASRYAQGSALVVATALVAIAVWRLAFAPPPVDRIVTVKVGEVPRAFHLHVPSRVKRPAPLVLDFHGWGSSALEEMALGRFDELADREEFIVAHAQGVGAMAGFNAGACCGEAVQRGFDDVGFAGAIIDAVSAEFPVDAKRVYAVGFSNGGFLAHRLACELSERVAAVASVAGDMGMVRCAPSRAVSVMQVHGTADQIVGFDGGGLAAFAPIASAMREWAERDGCAGAPSEAYAKGDVRCERYAGCREDAEVVLCTVDGGGHTWPGGPEIPTLGRTASDFDATGEIWRFFARHQLTR